MTAPDRIACLNPRCRRTAPRAKCEPGVTEIVCVKCWRTVPPDLRARDRHLRQRHRRLLRLRRRALRLGEAAALVRIGETVSRAWCENWERIRASFVRPDKPAGLDGFLAEIGL